MKDKLSSGIFAGMFVTKESQRQAGVVGKECNRG